MPTMFSPWWNRHHTEPEDRERQADIIRTQMLVTHLDVPCLPMTCDAAASAASSKKCAAKRRRSTSANEVVILKELGSGAVGKL